MNIKSIADVKRIPVGTRLFLVRSLLGEHAPKGRIVKQVRSNDIIMTVDDGSKKVGESSYLDLRGVIVTATEEGFRLTEKTSGMVCVEYKFAK